MFPKEWGKIVFGYMPSDGTSEKNQEYIPFWKTITEKCGAEFTFINNSLNSEEERKKVNACNSLVITGGNTYTLLNNLKRNGFDNSLKDFVKKDNFVLSAFSAGAIAISPTIKIVKEEWAFGPDTNLVGLKDLTGINLIDFEILPHYTAGADDALLEKYRLKSHYTVNAVSDDGYIIVELKNKKWVFYTVTTGFEIT